VSDGRTRLSLVPVFVPPLLVEDSVDGDGGLSGLRVTDNQVVLVTTNGNRGVDELDNGRHGLVDGVAGQDTRALKEAR